MVQLFKTISRNAKKFILFYKYIISMQIIVF